jgi:type I restriction enzyme, S subunit
MESLVEQLRLKDIDKSAWKKYRFDQIAKNISERVEPSNTILEIYVGLEHIDSESIHIKRFGKREDVNGTKLRCYPGDVIFGRRRAYQRKAAIVEFDGFCSAHSLVLRANQDVIHPKLFPFFLHSDTFMHRAVDISVGSLSPTINWGDLRKQEFILPPLNQQEQMAELFWVGNKLTDNLYKLKSATVISKRAFFINSIKGSAYKFLKDFADVTYGLGQPPEKDINGVAMIRATNISRGAITLKDMLYINKSAIPKGKDVFLNEGDLLVVRSGAYTGDVAIVTKEWEGAVAGYDLVVRPNRKKIDPLFLSEFLLEDENQSYFKGESVRSAQPHLNSTQVLNTKIPELKLDRQKKITTRLSAYYATINSINKKIEQQNILQKSLNNQIF